MWKGLIILGFCLPWRLLAADLEPSDFVRSLFLTEAKPDPIMAELFPGLSPSKTEIALKEIESIFIPEKIEEALQATGSNLPKEVLNHLALPYFRKSLLGERLFEVEEILLGWDSEYLHDFFARHGEPLEWDKFFQEFRENLEKPNLAQKTLLVHSFARLALDLFFASDDPSNQNLSLQLIQTITSSPQRFEPYLRLNLAIPSFSPSGLLLRETLVETSLWAFVRDLVISPNILEKLNEESRADPRFQNFRSEARWFQNRIRSGEFPNVEEVLQYSPRQLAYLYSLQNRRSPLIWNYADLQPISRAFHGSKVRLFKEKLMEVEEASEERQRERVVLEREKEISKEILLGSMGRALVGGLFLHRALKTYEYLNLSFLRADANIYGQMMKNLPPHWGPSSGRDPVLKQPNEQIIRSRIKEIIEGRLEIPKEANAAFRSAAEAGRINYQKRTQIEARIQKRVSAETWTNNLKSKWNALLDKASDYDAKLREMHEGELRGMNESSDPIRWGKSENILQDSHRAKLESQNLQRNFEARMAEKIALFNQAYRIEKRAQVSILWNQKKFASACWAGIHSLSRGVKAKEFMNGIRVGGFRGGRFPGSSFRRLSGDFDLIYPWTMKGRTWLQMLQANSRRMFGVAALFLIGWSFIEATARDAQDEANREWDRAKESPEDLADIYFPVETRNYLALIQRENIQDQIRQKIEQVNQIRLDHGKERLEVRVTSPELSYGQWANPILPVTYVLIYPEGMDLSAELFHARRGILIRFRKEEAHVWKLERTILLDRLPLRKQNKAEELIYSQEGEIRLDSERIGDLFSF